MVPLMDCQETWELVTDRYSVRNNLVLQFKRDEIDQSPRLAETLFNRFGRDGELEYSRQVCPPTRVGVRRDCGGVACAASLVAIYVEDLFTDDIAVHRCMDSVSSGARHPE